MDGVEAISPAASSRQNPHHEVMSPRVPVENLRAGLEEHYVMSRRGANMPVSCGRHCLRRHQPGSKRVPNSRIIDATLLWELEGR